MKLGHYSSEKLKKEIIETLGKYVDLSLYRVFFFGSRVMGAGTERSDIDVGIEGPKPVPDKEWLEIQEAFEDFPTLYKIEIVDFKKVAPLFKKVAMEHVESIWDPKHDQTSSNN